MNPVKVYEEDEQIKVAIEPNTITAIQLIKFVEASIGSIEKLERIGGNLVFKGKEPTATIHGELLTDEIIELIIKEFELYKQSNDDGNNK